MNEKKIILTEEQLDEALRFASMGGAGIYLQMVSKTH